MRSAYHTPDVSVIMPVYNVESQLARALESVRNQSLQSIEIIAVDDGSTDGSGALLDRLAERDFRLEVIHTPNSGAPAARNRALDRASGRYVYFMDADDWAEPTMLADMVELADAHKLELVIAGFYIDTYYGNEDQFLQELKSHSPAPEFASSGVYHSQQAFREEAWQLFDKNLLYTPWNKLFLRERIEQLKLRFRDTFWDDFPFVLDYIHDVESVGVIEKAYYHFLRSRAESETARWRPNMYEKREEEHGWMLDLYQHWQLSEHEASSEMVQRRYIERLVGCIENLCNPRCNLARSEKLRQIKQMITTDQAQRAVREARPRSRMMKLMLAPIKKKDALMTMFEGSFISFVKRHNTKLFATLRARR